MSRLTLDDITVDFPIYDAGHRSFRRALLATGIGGLISRRGRHHLEVRALDGVSLDLRDGDRIGLIGHNGSGKSTLLKVLAGIREPTGGSVAITGRTSALLSLGSILDPEMTGYENVDYASTLLEIPAKRRRSLCDEVAAFTELGLFLDLPVKTYSAGMQLRLSFALATAQEPDIMLLDEVFGAGDEHFRGKAESRMSELGHRTDIVVLASHSAAEIRRMCNKAVWLEHGRIRVFGPVDAVLAAYAEAASL